MLFNLKKEFFDAEVQVIQNNYPNGFVCRQYEKYFIWKFKLFCRSNGETLFVRISGHYKEAKSIAEGAVITVKHLGTNAYGTLLYPKFFRERTDTTWNDVVDQS
jgi:hypothetical protein